MPLVQALLLGGASPRAANLHNQSALRVARRYSLPLMEKLLARHGATPHAGADADADAGVGGVAPGPMRATAGTPPSP